MSFGRHFIHVTGINEAVKAYERIEKQIPFAMSKAINATAIATQKWTIDKLLPDTFTLRARGRPWQQPRQKYGFNIKPFATKTKLQAVLGSAADWLKEHEKGGTRRRGEHRIAIPSEEWKPKKELIARRKKPRALLRTKGKRRGFTGRPFVAGDKQPHLKPGIYAEVGGALKTLFRFQRQVRIERTLDFEKRAGAFALTQWPSAFDKAFADAMRTAK